MKKIYLLSLLSLITAGISAQQVMNSQIPPPLDNIEKEDVRNDLNEDLYLKKSINSKAFGDTLFYEDFNAGLAGWTVINNNPNNFLWEWDTIYKQGQFSTTRTEIKSTTAANGFMSLPVDFYTNSFYWKSRYGYLL